MILFFDTETTGMVDFKKPSDDECQPYMVSLAAILQTDDGRTVSTFYAIVRPEGYAIPDDASAIHGITTEIATRDGMLIGQALAMFHDLSRWAEIMVAYNHNFDRMIILGECSRNFIDSPFYLKKWHDPMIVLTPILKMPSRYGFKFPKLSEAYEYLFGMPLAGAHNALDDTKATAAVYWEMKKRGITF